MASGHNHEARLTNFLFTAGTNKDFTLSVQSSNINELSMGFAPYTTGAKDLKIPSNKIENSPLIVDFLVSEDYNEWIDVYKWMLRCKNNNDSHLSQIQPCSLVALTSQNRPGVEFIYTDSFPIELTGVDYAVNLDDSPIITATATFQFNQFKIVLPSGEIIDEQYTE